MAVKIRLARGGAKKRPFYRIVASDARSPRDGRFLEKLGTYNPMTEDGTLNVDRARVDYWLSVGAQPTDAVRRLLRKATATAG
ncbi:MAG: 30S ribosomal protein S16 [Myxococcales bacterium]|nr:30S ribosomal protein S16 [Myxococcales bacterium]